jgi:hypothetical protein
LQHNRIHTRRANPTYGLPPPHAHAPILVLEDDRYHPSQLLYNISD